MEKIFNKLGGRKFLAYFISVILFLVTDKLTGGDFVALTGLYIGFNTIQKFSDGIGGK